MSSLEVFNYRNQLENLSSFYGGSYGIEQTSGVSSWIGIVRMNASDADSAIDALNVGGVGFPIRLCWYGTAEEFNGYREETPLETYPVTVIDPSGYLTELIVPEAKPGERVVLTVSEDISDYVYIGVTDSLGNPVEVNRVSMVRNQYLGFIQPDSPCTVEIELVSNRMSVDVDLANETFTINTDSPCIDYFIFSSKKSSSSITGKQYNPGSGPVSFNNMPEWDVWDGNSFDIYTMADVNGYLAWGTTKNVPARMKEPFEPPSSGSYVLLGFYNNENYDEESRIFEYYYNTSSGEEIFSIGNSSIMSKVLYIKDQSTIEGSVGLVFTLENGNEDSSSEYSGIPFRYLFTTHETSSIDISDIYAKKDETGGNELSITRDGNNKLFMTIEEPYTGRYAYEIVINSECSDYIECPNRATEGQRVTFSITVPEFYIIEDFLITSRGKEVACTDNGDSTYSFIMPSGDVSIAISFIEA